MAVSDAVAKPEGKMKSKEWRVIMLASLGGALEYYDFVVYGIFAAYIAAAFFPATDPFVSFLLASLVFAVGYFARPIGGIVLSHFGDKYGRRKVFIVSILAMSAATTLMGLLPTYATWGAFASILMIILRLIQGLALGGELPGAITYVTETAPRRAGLACGLIFVCVNTGVLLASGTSVAMHELMPAADVAEWGWRIAFILGGVLGLVSFWLRLSLEETPEFERMKSQASKSPFGELVKNYPVQLLVGIAVVASMAGFNGLLFAHMPKYLGADLGYGPKIAAEVQMLMLVIISVGNLTFAWLGDKMPRRLLLSAGSLLVGLGAYPFYLAAVNKSVDIFLLASVAAVIASMFLGTFAAVIADLFPTRVRFTGVATAMNLSVTFFSATAPAIAATLIQTTGSTVAPAYYMTFCALLAFVGSLWLKRYSGQIKHEPE